MTAPTQDIKQIILAESKKLGFCFCGFTDCAPLADFPIYQAWIQSGFHGGMQYLARQDHLDKRENPRLFMAEAKSVVILGVSYQLYDAPSRFSIASFARYEDYHARIMELCESLMQSARKLSANPFDYKIAVDSAPVLERSLAVRAGCGWIGKNAMLIHPRFGSALLLAECFLSVPIAPDAPYPHDRCGTCERCVNACPTKCIHAHDRVIDAAKCISYQTIENKSEIDGELGDAFGNSVFGCDRCMQVCPWNKGNALHPTPLNLHAGGLPEIADLALSNEDFKKKYAKSPLLRAKQAGLARNIRNALSNEFNAHAIRRGE